MEVLELFDSRYGDFTAKHFWEKLVAEHGFTRSYNWLRLTLQARGRIKPAPRRGAHRRKRPRRPLPGMMLHQDGSRAASTGHNLSFQPKADSCGSNKSSNCGPYPSLATTFQVRVPGVMTMI